MHFAPPSKQSYYIFILGTVIAVYYVLIVVFNLFSVFITVGTILAIILTAIIASATQDKSFIELHSKTLYKLIADKSKKQKRKFEKLENRLNDLDRYPNRILSLFLIESAIIFGLLFVIYIGSVINVLVFYVVITYIVGVIIYIFFIIYLIFATLWNLKTLTRELVIKEGKNYSIEELNSKYFRQKS